MKILISLLSLISFNISEASWFSPKINKITDDNGIFDNNKLYSLKNKEIVRITTSSGKIYAATVDQMSIGGNGEIVVFMKVFQDDTFIKIILDKSSVHGTFRIEGKNIKEYSLKSLKNSSGETKYQFQF